MPPLTEPPSRSTATLRIELTDAPLSTSLQSPKTLAVFGFSEATPSASDDPRFLRVALPTHHTGRHEVWVVDGDVRCGRRDGVAWSEGGGLQFGVLEVTDAGDIETAAADAYTQLRKWLATSAYSHPLRLWNYMDAITEGAGDAERYRHFCVGRARGIGRELAPGELPAATAIGHPQRTGRFQLYWLAAQTRGTPLENPRQVQAWRYPRQYGPQPPGFARALLPNSPAMPLLLSGTAAVVGHASQHGDSLTAQLSEVLTNVHSLIDTARAQQPNLPAQLGAGSRLKVYVRDAAALAQVEAALEQRLPKVPRIVLHGAVCRHELQVEIDGSHA